MTRCTCCNARQPDGQREESGCYWCRGRVEHVDDDPRPTEPEGPVQQPMHWQYTSLYAR